MKRRFLTALSSVVTVALIWIGTAQAAGPSPQGPADVFLGSPFLILGIFAGWTATAFALYSASQMRGGKMAPVLNLLGVGLLLLDIGVMAVTFFTVNQTTRLIHDLGLLGGFVLALIALNRMRSIVG